MSLSEDINCALEDYDGSPVIEGKYFDIYMSDDEPAYISIHVFVSDKDDEDDDECDREWTTDSEFDWSYFQ